MFFDKERERALAHLHLPKQKPPKRGEWRWLGAHLTYKKIAQRARLRAKKFIYLGTNIKSQHKKLLRIGLKSSRMTFKFSSSLQTATRVELFGLIATSKFYFKYLDGEITCFTSSIEVGMSKEFNLIGKWECD